MKTFLKSIYTRFFLIILIPIILLQVITTYIFFERHWEHVTKHMQKAVIGEIQLLVKVINQGNRYSISNFNNALNLNIIFFPGKESIKPTPTAHPDRLLKQFETRLQENVSGEAKVYYIAGKSRIRSKILLDNGVVSIDFSSKRIKSPTTSIFFYWVTGSSILLILISLKFLRNQIKPIIKLTQAVEQLGKNQAVRKLTPSGAQEIRSAALAFNRMKQRIETQIYHRTEMLSHISHDLRTPITRIKLHLALLQGQDSDTLNAINNNLDEMEQMTGEYLSFVKGEGNESLNLVDINEEITNIVAQVQDPRIEYISKCGTSSIKLRILAFRRAVSNIINNAAGFAGHNIRLTLDNDSKYVFIAIEDDGPGIPQKKRKSAFQAFKKLDEKQKGYGLGLAITQSIIYAHGGDIKLRSSELGGLKVEIRIPY